MNAPSDLDIILAYHDATKHHFNRYARSAGYMDWANQPHPFRFYDGTERIALALAEKDPDCTYDALYTAPGSARAPLDRTGIGGFLELCLGLSAWKTAGASRWSLRMNPSSGNLHPTEGHLILPDSPGLPGGVFHYSPYWHALERRLHLPADSWPVLERHFYGSGFLMVLTSIFWRESWKYGERAYRYCNLDAGHALAAVAFAARAHGWRAATLTGAGDEQLETLLGFTDIDWPEGGAEAPDIICWISTEPPVQAVPRHLPPDWEMHFAGQPFAGTPNALSPRVVRWPIIDTVAAAGRKTATRPPKMSTDRDRPPPPDVEAPVAEPAAAVIRRRRSAVSYNPDKSIPRRVFFSILGHTRFRWSAAPFSAGWDTPDVNLVLFVHRVDDLSPGMYFLGRGADAGDQCRRAWRKDFLWTPAHATLPLWLLRTADVTGDAMTLSCHQDIAGSSAFAVAMIARFRERLEDAVFAYRQLYWECGMIGQVLYLEATAHRLGGTGIGCFFDDPVHDLLGIDDQSWQSLYHFTVGHPVEDDRLATLPPYHHLQA